MKLPEELLPCPFCGSKAGMTIGDGPFIGRVQIDCTSCRNATWWWEEAVAVRSWNRRAAPVAPAAVAPTPQQISDYLHMLDTIQREAVEREARALRPSAAHPDESVAFSEIIDRLQASFDTEGITENDSGDALIRLSSAIAAVEEVAAACASAAQPDERAAWLEELNALVLEYGNAVLVEGSASRIRHIKRIMDHARATTPQATVNGDERAAFEAWFADYHKEACEQFGGIDCTNPKDIAEDAWDAALGTQKGGE